MYVSEPGSEITTPSDDSGSKAPLALDLFIARRADLIGRGRDYNSARQLIGELTELTFGIIASVASTVVWEPGWSLMAVGGTGRGQLCPGSDIDLLLVHPKKAGDATIRSLSESLWYPFWNAGLKLSPSVHSEASALDLADLEVLTAVAWLDLRFVAGDTGTAQSFGDAALSQWRVKAKKYLPELLQMTADRHAKHGEVAFLLEPDLRDGRGGLRDVHVLSFIERSDHPAVSGAMERPVAELDDAHNALLRVRGELHRHTGRPNNRLLLQDQDAVAEGLGMASADALMSVVSASAKTIAWCTEESLRRLSDALNRRFASRFGRPMKVAPNLAVQSGEIVLGDDADPRTDPTLLLRTAAAAALNRAAISRETLRRLADEAAIMPDPWPELARNALVAVLGAGQDMLPVMEALDHYDLLSRVLPEWSAVRAKPQRNAYHRFTVDRHLCETAANAADLVRRVGRPDLLLIGAWLHDLGKGYPGDHTDVGIELMRVIGARMGFGPSDVNVLVDLVRHHLLVPDVATRRDLSDLGTIAHVAAAVKDVDRLQLLRTLTEADSLATGPTAWSGWKARLCDELVSRTEAVLSGRRPPEPVSPLGPSSEAMLTEARASGRLVLSVDPVEEGVVSLVAPDRPGLFALVAGSLSLHGVDVVSADVWTTDDGYAVDVLRVGRRIGGETNWVQVAKTMNGAIEGTLDLEADLAKRVASYSNTSTDRQARHLAAKPAVFVTDEIQDRATVVEVRAPDGLALLYRVTRVLSRLGLDITSAKVSTLGHEVVDAFSVVRLRPDGTRGKVGGEADAAEIRVAILDELARPR